MAPRASADSWNWSGASPTSSDWSAPDNWSPAGPPASGPSTRIAFTNAQRLVNTHGAFTLHELMFHGPFTGYPGVGPFELLSTGPLTFQPDPLLPAAQPSIMNYSEHPEIIRGDVAIPSGVTLKVYGQPGVTVGNATGSRIGGGGTLRLDTSLDFLLDNARTTPGSRGLELLAINFAGGNLNVFASDPNYTGSAPSIDVPSTTGNFMMKIKLPDTGANANSVGVADGMTANLLVRGDERTDGTARTGANAPRLFVNGTFNGGIGAVGNVAITAPGNSPVETITGGVGASAGTAYLGTHLPDGSRTLRVAGGVGAGTGGTLVVNPTLGAAGSVPARTVQIDGGADLSGGTVRFENSAVVTAGQGVLFDGPITGRGRVLLNVGGGASGVTFGPNTQLVVDRLGSLRIEGTATNIANLLTPARLDSVTRGSFGPDVGFLVVAATDAPFDLHGHLPPRSSAVELRVANSNPNGVDVRVNAAGGSALTTNVVIEPGAVLDAANNTIGNVRGAGTLLGPATLDWLNPGAEAPGTLSVTGALKFRRFVPVLRLDGPAVHATGDFSIIDPEGQNPGFGFGGFATGTSPKYGDQFTAIQLDAGSVLTGQLKDIPEGAVIPYSLTPGLSYRANYNVDSGDGSANDLVFTAVPEPSLFAPIAVGLITLPRRRRLRRKSVSAWSRSGGLL